MGIRPPKMKRPHWKEIGLVERLQQDNHKAQHPLRLLELPKPWSLSLLALNLTFKTVANMQGVVARLEGTDSCVNRANFSSAWMSWAPQICTYLQENGCSNATLHCSRPFQISIACPLWTICKKSPSSLQFSPLPPLQLHQILKKNNWLWKASSAKLQEKQKCAWN